MMTAQKAGVENAKRSTRRSVATEIATLIGKLKVGSRLYSLYSQKVKESLSLSLSPRRGN